MFGPMQIGMSKDKAKEVALKALDMVGLKGTEKINPYDLGLSERKMVSIAAIVAMDTKVVILMSRRSHRITWARREFRLS